MSLMEAVKAVFFGERHEPADAVPRSVLQQLSSIPRLTGILPYFGWMENESLFVLDQGAFCDKDELSLGFAIETMPQTGASEDMERVLASLFMSCPTGTGIQVSLYASPHILPTLVNQANMLPIDDGNDPHGMGWSERRNKNIYRVVARERIDFYTKGCSKSLFTQENYMLRNFRCVISVTMPLSPERPGDIEEALRIRESIHATLRSAHLPGRDWKPTDLLNFAIDFFDHERVLGRPRIDLIDYDDSKPLRQHLSNTEIASVVADTLIKFRKSGEEETAIQCFSIRQYPRYFRLSNMGQMIGDYFQMALSVPCPFLITMGAVVVDYESARTKAQMKAARATQNAGSKMAALQPDLQDRSRDWKMMLKTFENGGSSIKMYHQILLISRAADAAKCEHSIRAVWRARGFDLAKDVYLQHQALVSALPCTLTPGLQHDLEKFGRIGTKSGENAVMTAPLLAEWKGTKTPIMTLFGRRGQIMTFDLFDNTGGNYNFSVAALSGSGKSVFVNEMTYRYRGAGTKVWIIDVGRSYRNLCDLLDGEFIEFSDERENQICLNPFSMVNDINEDMEMLLPLIAQMASPRAPLDNYLYSALSGAIKRVWDHKQHQARITDVYELLKSGRLDEEAEHERDLTRLATSLEPYTKFGIYASYFEGEANIQFQKDFVVLELEELKSKKDLQAVVLQLMMYKITQEMYLDRSRKKLCIIDEAWDLMGNGSSAGFIETGYRRARKYGGAFGTITQSVEDYYKNDATKAAINNADWLFLLRQKPESVERLGKEGKLHVDEWMKRQLTSVSTQHGLYSEIFVHSPMGSGVGRLILDPFSMLLYSTQASDFEAIKYLVDTEGLTVGEAVRQILIQRGLIQ